VLQNECKAGGVKRLGGRKEDRRAFRGTCALFEKGDQKLGEGGGDSATWGGIGSLFKGENFREGKKKLCISGRGEGRGGDVKGCNRQEGSNGMEGWGTGRRPAEGFFFVRILV